MCDCGCKGYCSLFNVWEMLAWSCKHMITGKFPHERHDGQLWLYSDAARSTYSGKNLGFKAMCLFLKCGWAEVVHSLGFYSWSHGTSPCPSCFASADNLYTVQGFSALTFPHAAKTLAHYEADCRACEIELVLSRADIVEVRPHLGFDRNRKPWGGRVLAQDFPRLVYFVAIFWSLRKGRQTHSTSTQILLPSK